MIKIKEKEGINIQGSDFEIYMDLVCLHAAIVKNPELIKLDQKAMKVVEMAIKNNMIDEILGERI